MMVHIKSEYKIFDEDLPLLPGNKMRWWMKSMDTEENPWVRFSEQQLGNNHLNVDVDLAPGRYTAGVGDFDVVGATGKRAYQRLYFYVVPDGTVIYCAKKVDLPTYGEVIDMADGESYVEPVKKVVGGSLERYDLNPKKVGGIDYDKIDKSMTQVVVPFIRFCKYPRVQTIQDTDETFFLKKIMEIRASVCSDFKEVKPDAGYKCNNCVYAEELYINEEAVK